MMSRRGLPGGLPLALAGAARAEAAPVQIHAAVTVRPALDRVLAAWREAGGAAVTVYAPTPLLIRQLAGGAAADILLSADPDWIDAAVRQGLVRNDTRVDLMNNDLVRLGGPARRRSAPSQAASPWRRCSPAGGWRSATRPIIRRGAMQSKVCRRSGSGRRPSRTLRSSKAPRPPSCWWITARRALRSRSAPTSPATTRR
jgi:hypothetical protein